MAQQHPTTQETNVEAGEAHHDHGILEFLEKKEEENKPQEEISVEDFAKEHVHKAEEKKEEEVHHPLAGSTEQLPRSHNSGSSSDEEESEEGLKKKGMKDKIKEKIAGNKDENEVTPQVDGEVETGEKKGFMDKIKDILPGAHKKTEVETAPAAVPVEDTDKKGLMDKIKEKVPGHKQTEEGKAY